MKALLYEGFGDISVIKLREVDSPVLQENQVRIRVHASGINRADLVQRKGHYPPPPGESEIPGLEVAGEIMERGPAVDSLKLGDRVMALLAGGGYAEEVTVDKGLVLPIPDRLSFVEGAATMEVFLTAHHNLFHLGGARTGFSALIHAGGSGVGTAGLQLLREANVRGFTTVGSAEKAAACEKLGACAIQYKKEDFAQRIAVETKDNGVAVILDPVGAGYLESNFKALSTEGRLILIGVLSGSEAKIDLSVLLHKRIRVIGSTLRALPIPEKTAVVSRFRKDFFQKLSDGKLTPIVDQVFPVEKVGEAQSRMQANLNIGKIILKWNECPE